MTLEVKKHERETTQSLVRRFGKRIQQSGICCEPEKSGSERGPKVAKLKKELP